MPRKIDLTEEQAGLMIQHFQPQMRMVRLLGAGSFGQVFLIEDDVCRVAVKIIPLQLRNEENPEQNHEWQQLTTQWDRLNHASLVRIRSFTEHVADDPNDPIERYGLIFMDYWPIDLHDYIKRLLREGLLTPVRKRTLLNNLANLLCRLLADTGLIVTDLKLENVLVAARDPGPMQLALIDLGGVWEARLADYYRVITTDYYMAPELHTHSITRIDDKILQFSFGLIGYYILEGRWPVADYDYLQPLLIKLRAQGNLNWSEEVQTTMPGSVAIIERCLQEERAHRFPDLFALVAALQADEARWEKERNLQTQTLIQAHPPPRPPTRKKGQPTLWHEPLTGMELFWIPSGGFEMGQSPEETKQLQWVNDEAAFEKWYARELPRRRVMLDGFWMGRFPVTKAQFARFVAETLHLTDTERIQFAARYNKRQHKQLHWYTWKKPKYHQEDNHPVIHVSWFDAKRFAAWLSDRTGLTFDLPSEAQWEYACHGGGSSPYHFGATISTTQANYDGSTTYGSGHTGTVRKGTMPCGQFPANHYGLHDMHGNVWEWCEDLYDTQFYTTPTARLRNPVNGGLIGYRIKRGGSWRSPAAMLRAAYRGGTYPDIGKDDIGFRLIMKPALQMAGPDTQQKK
ncbi:MAG: SUMF1/EgtB/PvdO family nonheme iron enzyme [Magnetococcales bacterium]|nr:SUMF1/EgtB/PvdO family nonheme iron enzyme [Magnetococcales bacterium]NGZ06887.1 SUMF1/EgtB/PvdO family nonheme iron enzyme [Magnetococcales bacterium]